MSRRTHDRAIVQRQRLTGEGHQQAQASYHPHGCTPERPVPAAVSRSQRELEACALYELIRWHSPFRDHTDVPLGIVKVRPLPDRLIVHPAPGLAAEMVLHLLPHYVESYGGVIGIPGLRLAGTPARRDPYWKLTVLDTAASIWITAAPDHHLLPDRHPDDHPLSPYRPLWHHPARHPDEREAGYLMPEAWRDTYDVDELIDLLSGVLRRTYLFDQLWTGCDFNPYEHCRTDLIVEWCCGPSLSERVDLWLGSGLGLEVDRIYWSDPDRSTGEATFTKPADALILRRRGNQCRRTQPNLIGRPGA